MIDSYHYKYNPNNVKSVDRCQNNGESPIRPDYNFFHRFDYFDIDSFFLNARFNEIEKHRKNIIKKYKEWQKIDFKIDKFPLGIDLNTFRSDNLKLTVVELINSVVNKPKRESETTEEMALAHLKSYYVDDNCFVA